MSTAKRLQLVFVAAACLPLAACSETFFRTPKLLHPGPAPYQQARAEQFDPYPPNDVAPKIVGGRPLDYAVPANEVTRSRQYLSAVRGSAQPTYVPTPGSAYPSVITPPPAYIPPGGYAPSPVLVPPSSASAAPPVKYRY